MTTRIIGLNKLFSHITCKFRPTDIKSFAENVLQLSLIQAASKMSYDGFSQEYKSTLKDIAENFTENLIRLTNDDIDRFKARKNIRPAFFQDVGITMDGITLKLENIKITQRPTIQLKHLYVDFENVCIDTEFNFSDIIIESDYTVITKTLAAQNEKLRINVHEVPANGRIGLFIEGDSFMPRNFDLQFEIKKVNINVVESEQGGSVHLQKFTEASDPQSESKILSLLKMDLEAYLVSVVIGIMGENIVEFSASEMLIDEPEHMRNYIDWRKQKANALFDKKLAELKQKFASSAASRNFSNNFLHDNKVVSSDGTFSKTMPQLQRHKDVSIHTDGAKSIYYGYAKFEDMKCALENCKLGNDSYNLTFVPDRNKVFVRIVESEGGKQESSAHFVQFEELYAEDEHAPDRAIQKKLMPFILSDLRLLPRITC